VRQSYLHDAIPRVVELPETEGLVPRAGNHQVVVFYELDFFDLAVVRPENLLLAGLKMLHLELVIATTGDDSAVIPTKTHTKLGSVVVVTQFSFLLDVHRIPHQLRSTPGIVLRIGTITVDLPHPHGFVPGGTL